MATEETTATMYRNADGDRYEVRQYRDRCFNLPCVDVLYGGVYARRGMLMDTARLAEWLGEQGMAPVLD